MLETHEEKHPDRQHNGSRSSKWVFVLVGLLFSRCSCACFILDNIQVH